MTYAIATLKTNNNTGKVETVSIVENITIEEYQNFMSAFDILFSYGEIKNLFEICIDSHAELKRFLSPDNIGEMFVSKTIPRRKIAQIANRLLVNYCAAMYLFLNKTPGNLKKYVNEDIIQEHFTKTTNEMYDNPSDRSYCFFTKMRNYIMHNRLPFTLISGSIENGFRLIMQKEELLSDKNWGPAKEVIKNCDDYLDIIPLLERCSSNLYLLYNKALYCFSFVMPEIDSRICLFQKKHSSQEFVFVEYENISDLSNAQCSIINVPWRSMFIFKKDISHALGVYTNCGGA